MSTFLYFCALIILNTNRDDCLVDLKMGHIKESMICYKKLLYVFDPYIHRDLFYIYLDKRNGISNYEEAMEYVYFFNKKERIIEALGYYELTDENRALLEKELERIER